MKRSKFLIGEKKKPNISHLLGKYIQTSAREVYYVIPASILATDGTIPTRKRVTWPSDSLMKAPCAWMPFMVHWIDLENGEIVEIDPKERRLNPADKLAWGLNKYNKTDNFLLY